MMRWSWSAGEQGIGEGTVCNVAVRMAEGSSVNGQRRDPLYLALPMHAICTLVLACCEIWG